MLVEVAPPAVTDTEKTPVELAAGMVMVICVSPVTVMPEVTVAAEPKVTAVAPVKPLPVMVRVPPPEFCDVTGERLATTG